MWQRWLNVSAVNAFFPTYRRERAPHDWLAAKGPMSARVDRYAQPSPGARSVSACAAF